MIKDRIESDKKNNEERKSNKISKYFRLLLCNPIPKTLEMAIYRFLQIISYSDGITYISASDIVFENRALSRNTKTYER
jgi:hypothetical protein